MLQACASPDSYAAKADIKGTQARTQARKPLIVLFLQKEGREPTSRPWPRRATRHVRAHQLADGAVQPLPHPRDAHHAAAAAGLHGNAVGLQASRDTLEELLLK